MKKESGRKELKNGGGVFLNTEGNLNSPGEREGLPDPEGNFNSPREREGHFRTRRGISILRGRGKVTS
jgi:hypothetical protein